MSRSAECLRTHSDRSNGGWISKNDRPPMHSSMTTRNLCTTGAELPGSLFEDKEGNIWVGTAKGLLLRSTRNNLLALRRVGQRRSGWRACIQKRRSAGRGARDAGRTDTKGQHKKCIFFVSSSAISPLQFLSLCSRSLGHAQSSARLTLQDLLSSSLSATMHSLLTARQSHSPVRARLCFVR
jgi:hypothetical protein